MNSQYIYTNRTPYFYIIQHLKSGRFYAGCRWAKGCHPKDLLVSYETSSLPVKRIIKKHGPEEFRILRIETFDSIEEVWDAESSFLSSINAKDSKNWYNVTNGFKSNSTPEEVLQLISETSSKRRWSKEAKQKQSERYKGAGNPMYGISRKGETRNLSEEGAENIKKAVSNTFPARCSICKESVGRIHKDGILSKTGLFESVMIGRVFSDTAKENIKAGYRKLGRSEKISKAHKGKTVSCKTRMLISRTAKERLRLPWKNPKAKQELWKNADRFHSFWIANGMPSHYQLERHFKNGLSFANLVKNFRNGWVPEEDEKWIQEFKKK